MHNWWEEIEKKKLLARQVCSYCYCLLYFPIVYTQKINTIHWNFDWRSCFVVFFLEWNEWKNPQFNFSSPNLSIERNFFKWDGKETKILHLLFHRIWKKLFLRALLKILQIFVAPHWLFNNWRKKMPLFKKKYIHIYVMLHALQRGRNSWGRGVVI